MRADEVITGGTDNKRYDRNQPQGVMSLRLIGVRVIPSCEGMPANPRPECFSVLLAKSRPTAPLQTLRPFRTWSRLPLRSPFHSQKYSHTPFRADGIR